MQKCHRVQGDASEESSIQGSTSEDGLHLLFNSLRLVHSALTAQQTPAQDEWVDVAFDGPASIEKPSPLRQSIVLGSAFVHDGRRV